MNRKGSQREDEEAPGQNRNHRSQASEPKKNLRRKDDCGESEIESWVVLHTGKLYLARLSKSD